MTGTSHLMSELSALSASFGLPPKKSIRASQRLLKLETDSNTTTARRYLALGHAYRSRFRMDEAIKAFHQARRHAMEDMGPNGQVYALACWALANSYALDVQFAEAEKYYWQTLKLFVHIYGVGSAQVRACLSDFHELAEGLSRDRTLRLKLSGILELNSLMR